MPSESYRKIRFSIEEKKVFQMGIFSECSFFLEIFNYAKTPNLFENPFKDTDFLIFD